MAKSAKKSQAVKFVTGWLLARFPKITKADTEGKFADGKFKTDGILVDQDSVSEVRAELLEVGKKFWPDVAEEDIRLPLKMFMDGRKDEEKTEAGWGLVLKSQYQPACFDAKKKKLPAGKQIGGGSVIRVASAIFPWSKSETETIVDAATNKKTKQTVTAYGIGLRLGDVQVKELVENAAGGTGADFDEVEGFEYSSDDDADTDSFNDDATDL